MAETSIFLFFAGCIFGYGFGKMNQQAKSDKHIYDLRQILSRLYGRLQELSKGDEPSLNELLKDLDDRIDLLNTKHKF